MDRRLILLLYGLIGFAALGYELCWFRILVFYLQSATYSFSIMLTLFLLGVASGSVFFSASLEGRLERASADFRTVLGGVQLLIAVIGASTLHVSTWIPGVWIWLIGGLGAGSWLVILLQKVIVAALVILPTTFLFGISFWLFIQSKGPSLMGKVGPAALGGIALGGFALQCMLARAWLARFRFGPAEWLWRTATYWKTQPLAASSTLAGQQQHAADDASRRS